MPLPRSRIGPALAVGGAIELIVSLWLPWYFEARACIAFGRVPRLAPIGHRLLGLCGVIPVGSRSYSAWDAYDMGVALLTLALAAIVLALAAPALALRVAPQLALTAAFSRSFAWLCVTAVGWSAVAASIWTIVAIRPGIPSVGFFVALLGGGGIIGGGWWSIRAHQPALAHPPAQSPDPS